MRDITTICVTLLHDKYLSRSPGLDPLVSNRNEDDKDEDVDD